MVDLFILEHTPEAFHRGVVVAIPFPAHGRPHPEPVKQRGIFLGAILALSIRVVNQTRWGSGLWINPGGFIGDEMKKRDRSGIK
jgi:hypothetical protein